MLVLSGGTGTPKLLSGLKEIAEFWVVVNTAEDLWISGNKICPDLDSVIYTLAGIIDNYKWWGIKDDTFITHETLKSLGFEEILMIGDRDRAIHILRSEILRSGYTLTEATKIVTRALNVKFEVYPMCDEDVSTIIVTNTGKMHFQEFWVKYGGKLEVLDVYFRGIEKAKIPQEVKKKLKKEDEVLIGPSNPITSILPILKIENFAKFLQDKKVIAVSPIIGNKPFSGPAAKFMRALGYEVSSRGVFELYKDFLDVLIIDEKDLVKVDKSVRCDIRIRNKMDAIRLSKFIIKIFDEL
ncbi:2-phospho-L-lactate transferase [Archaeoglobales archaeon ex4484_92]|nr:MAG: 2-phospho-L-lactate transferase [Archaeoglobales archaeon ex4484_92]